MRVAAIGAMSFGILAVAALFALVGCTTVTAQTEPGSFSKSGISALPTSTVNDAMLACLHEAGWRAEMDWGATIDHGNVPAEQVEWLRQDPDACIAETGWGNLQGLDASQIATLHDREVETYQCLLNLGERPDEPPTKQRYVDTFASGEQYFAIAGVIATADVVSSCPPPTWFMNW